MWAVPFPRLGSLQKERLAEQEYLLYLLSNCWYSKFLQPKLPNNNGLNLTTVSHRTVSHNEPILPSLLFCQVFYHRNRKRNKCNTQLQWNIRVASKENSSKQIYLASAHPSQGWDIALVVWPLEVRRIPLNRCPARAYNTKKDTFSNVMYQNVGVKDWIVTLLVTNQYN